MRLSVLDLSPGLRDLPLPSVEEALAYRYDGDEDILRFQLRTRHVVGGPESVRAQLSELVAATGADELIVTTQVHSHEERRRSYERLAALDL